MDKIINEIPLSGFDPEGEPSISVMSSGIIYLEFEFMPPSDMEDKEGYFLKHFEKQLSHAIGLPVTWEDREIFSIGKPRQDTIERIKQFISQYRKTYATELGL